MPGHGEDGAVHVEICSSAWKEGGLDVIQRRRPRSPGCRVWPAAARAMRTNQLVKYILFISCYLFWVASGLMIAVGLYAKLSKESGAVDSLLAEPSLIVIIVGALTFTVTFVGCTGALRDMPLLLKMFAVMLLLIFMLQIVAVGVAFLFSGQRQVMDKAAFLMGKAIASYRDDLDLQNLIDYIQKKFECCGVRSYKDWSHNEYFDCSISNPSLERCAVPFSCCVPEEEQNVLNTMCGYETQNLKAWKAERLIHTGGCLEKIVTWGRSNLYLIAGLALGLLAMEVIVFSLAVTLIYQISFIIQKRTNTKRKS
ncbi:LOW QUALITY PROTEIN: tetraspanin-33-like [Trichosurus vulpecula]|uniref:LOW QUALITY PROTEIN: tetraspanin-33-like n=1 Tax=Trichosurus vulpecula TaxID=9337 RepID=UPI00186B2509|nr:LOW QUALITY PROTEIN: tetraspanin-33-like [Trichosurus vulpecula]